MSLQVPIFGEIDVRLLDDRCSLVSVVRRGQLERVAKHANDMATVAIYATIYNPRLSKDFFDITRIIN